MAATYKAAYPACGPAAWAATTRPAYRGGVSGPSYDADAQAYFTAAGVNSEPYLAGINQFVLDLKAASLWTKFDRLWIFANQDATAALTCIKSLSVATPQNTPTFAAGQGYTFDDSTNYLNSGFEPANDGVQFALDAAHLGFFIRTFSAEGDVFAAVNGATSAAHVLITAGATLFGINRPWISSNVAGGGTGYHLVSRTASDLTTAYKNGSSIGTSALASVALVPQALFIGARNNTGGGADQFFGGQISLAHAGGALDGTEAAALDTAIDTLKATIGF